jgi:hypothetical protein
MSEQKTAKVEDVIQIREWTNPTTQQVIYYHVIALDNGDKGSVGKKSRDAVKVGDTLTYTIDGDKIKQVQQNGFGGGFKGGQQRGSSASFALSYSKDLMCSIVASGKTADLKALEIADATMIIAGRFKNWLKENE